MKSYILISELILKFYISIFSTNLVSFTMYQNNKIYKKSNKFYFFGFILICRSILTF